MINFDFVNFNNIITSKLNSIRDKIYSIKIEHGSVYCMVLCWL